jgi:hypothetical protein
MINHYPPIVKSLSVSTGNRIKTVLEAVGVLNRGLCSSKKSMSLPTTPCPFGVVGFLLGDWAG